MSEIKLVEVKIESENDGENIYTILDPEKIKLLLEKDEGFLGSVLRTVFFS